MGNKNESTLKNTYKACLMAVCLLQQNESKILHLPTRFNYRFNALQFDLAFMYLQKHLQFESLEM